MASKKKVVIKEKKKKEEKKKKPWRKVNEDLCCVCRKSSEIKLSHPNDQCLQIGLCEKHWGEYADMKTNEEHIAFKVKYFNKEIKEEKTQCPVVNTPMPVESPQKSVVVQLPK